MNLAEDIAKHEAHVNMLCEIIPALDEVERLQNEELDKIGVPPGESSMARLVLTRRSQVCLTDQQLADIEWRKYKDVERAREQDEAAELRELQANGLLF